MIEVTHWVPKIPASAPTAAVTVCNLVTQGMSPRWVHFSVNKVTCPDCLAHPDYRAALKVYKENLLKQMLERGTQ